MNTRSSAFAIVALLCSVIVVCALSACSSTPQSAQTIPPVTTPTTTLTPTTSPAATQSGPLDGAALFANKCSACHSTTEIAPGVNGLSDTDLAKFISSHNSGVDLTAAQRSLIAGYLVGSCVDEG